MRGSPDHGSQSQPAELTDRCLDLISSIFCFLSTTALRETMTSSPPLKPSSSIQHEEHATSKEHMEGSLKSGDGEPEGALAVLRAHADEEPITPAEVRKLIRKIDMLLMPLVS